LNHNGSLKVIGKGAKLGAMGEGNSLEQRCGEEQREENKPTKRPDGAQRM
jgi:hypothetical protein